MSSTMNAPEFYEMHGLPVSLGPVPGCPYPCAQWSSNRPERFSEVGVRERGKRLSEAQFRDLIRVMQLGW